MEQHAQFPNPPANPRLHEDLIRLLENHTGSYAHLLGVVKKLELSLYGEDGTTGLTGRLMKLEFELQAMKAAAAENAGRRHRWLVAIGTSVAGLWLKIAYDWITRVQTT